MGEWKEQLLEEVMTLKRGYDLSAAKRTPGSVPIVTSSGFGETHNEAMAQPPGVVTGRYGTIGQVFFVTVPYWPLNTTLYVKDFKGNDERFIYYFLKAFDFEKFNDKSTIPGINRNHLYTEVVRLPSSKDEQRAIASVLGSLDAKIDLLHRQNKTLEGMAEALFRQWFVEEAEEGWEEVRLGNYIGTNERSLTKDSPLASIKYLDTGSITKGHIEGFEELAMKDAPSRARRLVQHNDIVYSTVRPIHCHYGMIKDPPDDLIVSTGFCVVTAKTLGPHFVYYLLTTPDMTEFLHSVAEGSTSTYPSLKPSDIEAVEFQLPPKKRMTEFETIAAANWDRISNNYRQIKSLTALRDTLLPKLMSGEVRVELKNFNSKTNG